MFLHVTKVALAPRTMRCSVPALRRGHGSVRRSASRRFVRVGWLFISSGLRIRDRNRHPRPISAQRARDGTYWPGHGPQRRAQAPRASSHVGSLLGWIPSVDRHGLRLKSQGGGGGMPARACRVRKAIHPCRCCQLPPVSGRVKFPVNGRRA